MQNFSPVIPAVSACSGPNLGLVAKFAMITLLLICAALLARPPALGQGIEAQQKRVLLRVLTADEFPPFNYYDDENVLAGLNVDLARAICLDLSLACDIRVRPWAELLPALKRGETDTVMAGHAISAGTVQEFEFSDPYFYTPGRFAFPRGSEVRDVTPESLIGVRIGVAKGTAHEAFLKAFFRDSRIVAFGSAEAAREALRTGKVDATFDDSVSLAFWLNGTLSRQCCEFRGGAYFESKFFGHGLAIALKKSDPELKLLLNAALTRIKQNGQLEELVQRYFPVQAY